MTAFADTKNNEIYGATEGTKTWWHEKGHLKYNKTAKGARRNFNFQSYLFVTICMTVVSLFFPLFKWAALIGILITVYYYVFEEVWCWIYAFKMYNLQKITTKFMGGANEIFKKSIQEKKEGN